MPNAPTLTKCGLPLAASHEQCFHSFEDWDAIHAAQPWHMRLPRFLWLKWAHLVKNPWEKTVGFRMAQFARRLRLFAYGYDPNEWWNHHRVVSYVAIRHLKTMRDRGHGIPAGRHPNAANIQGISLNGEGRDEWTAMLNDMIFWHKAMTGALPEVEKSYNGIGRDKGKVVTYKAPPDFADLSPDDQRRYRRGKLYYTQYFEQLWD